MPDESNIIDLFFLTANPNPERTGCPGWAIINQIADKTLPVGHPARLHLADCSPCYQDFQYLEKAHRALGSKLPS